MLSLPQILYNAGLKRLLWVQHVVRVDVSLMPRKVMGGSFRGRKSLGKPRGRWEDVVRREAVDFLKITNWNLAARNRKGWRRS
jgi:hypothetical protein